MRCIFCETKMSFYTQNKIIIHQNIEVNNPNYCERIKQQCVRLAFVSHVSD